VHTYLSQRLALRSNWGVQFVNCFRRDLYGGIPVRVLSTVTF
jgi:hypothetical protein